MRRRALGAALCALVLWLAAPALAAQNPVHVSAAAPAEPVPAGGRFEVVLDVRVDAPYHIYAHDSKGEILPTAVKGEASEGLRFVEVIHPESAHELFDPILGETWRVLDGAFSFGVVFEVAPGHPPGPARATISIEYQACDDRGCLFPVEETHAVDLQVRAPTAEDLPGPPPPTDGGAAGGGDDGTLESRLAAALRSGELGKLLWLSLIFGFVSLLTPCVFPMIPITVSFFAKRGAAQGGGTRYALAYGLGIVATYTGFGMGLATLLGASSLQRFATDPWANLALAALFVFFGLSLMGFYDLRPPRFLARRAEAGLSAQAKPGYMPVFVMGFVFTITAFTCTAPIVGSLLAALTAGGSPWLIAAGMLVYSAAFALPFVLLAMFPAMASALPGAGGWMITLKVVLGFVEVVAALKFLSNADIAWGLQLLPRSSVLLLTLIVTLMMSLYLFGAFKLPHDVAGRRRLLSLRTFWACVALALSFYFARGLAGRELDSWTESYLPPREYGAPSSTEHDERIAWIEDHDEALAVAAATGRRVFVDFTGVTCVNCRKVEKTIFVDERFAEALEKVVAARLYTDRRSPEHRAGDLANQRRMEALGSVTLPLYVLLDSDGTPLRKMGYSPDFDVDDFIRFLEAP